MSNIGTSSRSRGRADRLHRFAVAFAAAAILVAVGSGSVIVRSLQTPLSPSLLLVIPLFAGCLLAHRLPARWGGPNPGVACGGDGVAGIQAVLTLAIAILVIANMHQF